MHFADLTPIASFITSLATLLYVFRIGKKVETVRHATNSLVEQLVKTTRTEAHAAGMKEQKEMTRE
jgi:uncharacterized membrane protein